MKYLSLILLMAAFFCPGCAAGIGRPDVDVVIVNSSSHKLSNAEAQFGDYRCEWGTVGLKSTAGYGFFPHPITSDTTLSWWEEGRGQRSKKLDLRKIYPAGSAGRLTFTVSDDGVIANFKKE